jgi:hypothetical protein
MLASKAIHAANELRALLHDEALPRLGLVDVGKGSRLTFELAVGVTLTDLDRLTARVNAGQVVHAGRWHQLGEDLERLYRMVVTARRSWGRE